MTREREVLTPNNEALALVAEIKENYGIEIPTSIQDVYRHYYSSSGDYDENTVLNAEEAKVVSKILEKVPGAGTLSQLLIPYGQGFMNSSYGPWSSYMGFDWPEENGLVFNQDLPVPLSRQAAINLHIARPYPREKDDPDVPHLIENTPQAEKFEFSLIASFGASLLDHVTLQQSGWTFGYLEKVNDRAIDTIHIFDTGNPLLKSFAELTGWKLTTYMVWIKQMEKYDKDFNKEFQRQTRDEGLANKPLWLRDPKVWGKINNRRTRFEGWDHLVETSFVSFWAASIVSPEKLTEEERQFFSVLHEGLKSPDPKGFIVELAKDKVTF